MESSMGNPNRASLTLAVLILIPATLAFSVELKPLTVIGSPLKDRKEAWPGHIDFLVWLDDDTLVHGGEAGFIKCHRLAPTKSVWTRKFKAKIDSIDAGGGSIFVLVADETLHALDPATGSSTRQITAEALAKSARKEYLFPGKLTWISRGNRLLIATSADNYGYHGYLLSARTFALAGRTRMDGEAPDIASTKDGRYFVSRTRRTIRIWSDAAKREVLKLGGRSKRDAGGFHDPFFSNALFDGKNTLLYSVDYGSSAVHVYDTKYRKERARFSSRNGHLEMDADFKASRIALTGTSQNLTLVDFSGKVLAERQKVAVQRIISAKFSPSGKRLAVGSWDNTVRLFDVNP
jgi:WD40 repeat protein